MLKQRVFLVCQHCGAWRDASGRGKRRSGAPFGVDYEHRFSVEQHIRCPNPPQSPEAELGFRVLRTGDPDFTISLCWGEAKVARGLATLGWAVQSFNPFRIEGQAGGRFIRRAPTRLIAFGCGAGPSDVAVTREQCLACSGCQILFPSAGEAEHAVTHGALNRTLERLPGMLEGLV